MKDAEEEPSVVKNKDDFFSRPYLHKEIWDGCCIMLAGMTTP